jgi:hypothetical protein
MTPSRRLLDRQIPGGLDAFVAERREQRASWESIARDIDEATNRTDAVTANTLRRWYVRTDDAADRQVPVLSISTPGTAA